MKTTTATASTGLVRAADGALPRGVDIAKVHKSVAGGRTAVLPTTEPVTAGQAQAVVAELRQRADVVWASPNYVMRPFAESPVPASDKHFVSDLVRAVWDKRSKYDYRVKQVMGASNTFGAGGFSSKAPYLWRATTGQDQVVAVIDTGSTPHNDLAEDRILPGYDFVSRVELEPGVYRNSGRDGDGWDGNPKDQGDWETQGYCYRNSPASNSSWHGTHVTGIIGATKDNGGIVGVAPSVKLLPVRVLGLCGGTTEDIAAGIRWAAGLSVTDPLGSVAVPVNENPADVINLSLGAYLTEDGETFDQCSDVPPLLDAVAAARAAGSVIVAAAGNENININTYHPVPATCPGVISVGATSEYGDRAGYRNPNNTKSTYSNYGSTLDISAPGGDFYWDRRGIWSTLNTGRTTQITGTYEQYAGTSMAAPVVSAGAALIRSLGEFTPAQTEAALKTAVQPFPKGTAANFKPCRTAICGKGILSLSKVAAPLSGAAISGDLAVGEPLTALPGTWNALPEAFSYAWFRDGEPISGATGATYVVRSEDIGTAISVRLAPVGVFAPITSTSAGTPPVQQGPAVTLTGLPASTTYGVDATARVVVDDGAAVPGAVVELRRGSSVLGTGTTDETGAVDIPIAGTKWAGGTNTIRAAFVGTEARPAASSTSQTVTVARAASAVTTKLATSIRSTWHAHLGVTVTVPGVANPTGALTVYDGSRKIVSTALSSTGGGKKTITLPLLSKGYHHIKVVYAGSSVISSKTSISRTIRSY